MPLALLYGFQADMMKANARPSELTIKADEDKAGWLISRGISLPGKEQLAPSQQPVRAGDVELGTDRDVTLDPKAIRNERD